MRTIAAQPSPQRSRRARSAHAAPIVRSAVELDERLRPRHAVPGDVLRPCLRVGLAHLPPGPVDLAEIVSADQGALGLLVLDGLMLLETAAGRARVGWLVGPEDLLRPWDIGEISLVRESSCRVLSPTRLALLDRDLARRAGGAMPQVIGEAMSRAVRTTHWLLAKTLVASAPVVDEKLLLLFALLGERWGTVTPEGVAIDLPLTHSMLATLCGTRRPTVTTALHMLEREELVKRTGDTWLLRRTTPAGCKLPSCWPQYAAALGLG